MLSSVEKIKFINNILPPSTNTEIIKLLTEARWQVGIDKETNNARYNDLFSGKYYGFSYDPYNLQRSQSNPFTNAQTRSDYELFLYGKIIFQKVCHEINFKKAKLVRLIYNMYYPHHNTSTHTDVTSVEESVECYSILYNLHTTDGGTEVDNCFYKDQMGQAKVFLSNINHKGIGPKKDNVRFSLNILADRYIK